MKSFKSAYSRFFAACPDRLHFAAHSHHPWPDCTREAQLRYWEDATREMDQKWSGAVARELSEAKSHIARILDLSDPTSIATAPNTHEFVARLFSCFDLTRPLRILTTDSEFHSFARQLARFEELDQVTATRIPVEPFESFEDRFSAEAASGQFDLIFFSHVFFNSGFVISDLKRIVDSARETQAKIVIDGYHGFRAIPTSLRQLEDRAYYLAGGYKYAQAGEGACFMHIPVSSEDRPLNTGWFAELGNLEQTVRGRVTYPPGADRFMGSTFDPSGWYRFNAVMAWITHEKLSMPELTHRTRRLQENFNIRLEDQLPGFAKTRIIFPSNLERQGCFLTFRTSMAQAIQTELASLNVNVDSRGDRLRFGFGLYHDTDDFDLLFERMGRCASLKV